MLYNASLRTSHNCIVLQRCFAPWARHLTPLLPQQRTPLAHLQAAARQAARICTPLEAQLALYRSTPKRLVVIVRQQRICHGIRRVLVVIKHICFCLA
jgi:hypothetical protein